MRALIATAGALACVLAAWPAQANPCEDARDVSPTRTEVSRPCVRACIRAVVKTIPTLEADLRLCRSTAESDLEEALACLTAANAQTVRLGQLLDKAGRPPPPRPWWRFPVFWGIAGAAVGAGAVWTWTLIP